MLAKFNPWTGTQFQRPRTAESLRGDHKMPWVFDPFTGQQREAKYVLIDPQGLGLGVPRLTADEGTKITEGIALMMENNTALEIQSGGLKYDSDKPRMDLLDPHAIEQLAKVLTFGASKYAAHNWRKGLHKSRLIAAALRHLFAYLGGQDKDPETGLSHVAHAMCCCMFLLGLEHRPELDDRWKP